MPAPLCDAAAIALWRRVRTTATTATVFCENAPPPLCVGERTIEVTPPPGADAERAYAALRDAALVTTGAHVLPPAAAATTATFVLSSGPMRHRLCDAAGVRLFVALARAGVLRDHQTVSFGGDCRRVFAVTDVFTPLEKQDDD